MMDIWWANQTCKQMISISRNFFLAFEESPIRTETNVSTTPIFHLN
jgi:hypothetical protein